MADVIGSAQVNVGADVSAAENAVRRLQGQFDRAMADMGRQRAEAEVTADTTDLSRKLAEAKRELLELDKAHADPSVELDDGKFQIEKKRLEAQIRELSQQKIEIGVDASQLRDANRLAAQSARKQELMAKQSEKLLRAEKKLNAEREKERLISERNALAAVKERSDVERLRATYAKLAGQRQRMEKSTGRPGGIFRTANESRELSRLAADMDLAEHKIRALGGTVDDIDPDLERHQGLLGKWATSIASVRIQAGFFSATLRQMAIGLVALGPIITGLGGALVSLVGVAGTGLAGALAVSTGAAAGFGLAALGVGLVLKPIVGDFKAAAAASKAYNDAVLKYGKGSDEAKTAQEKLNQTLKGVSPAARAAIKDFGGISTTWDKLTAKARAPVFDAIGASIRTVQALLPTFASQTVATTRTLSEGWQRWMNSLRSQGAKQALQELMSNFNASLPSILNGLGSLGSMLGRISVSSSKFLPDLSHGFAEWAQSLQEGVGSGAALDSRIGRLVQHMRDIGHLTQATGKLLSTFFSSSADSGDDLIKSFTDTERAWTSWMQSVEGQQSLKSFFAEAAGETEQFFSALGNITTLLFQFSRATAPVVNGLLTVVTTIGDVVQALMSLKGVDTVMKGIGITLAGLFVVSKVKAFATAIRDAAAAVKGLVIAQTASDIAAAGAGGGFLSRLFGRGGGRAAAAEVGAVGSQLSMLTGRAGAAAGAAGLLSAALSPQVLIPAAAMGALILFIGKIEDTETAWDKAVAAFKETRDDIPNAIRGITKETERYTSAQNEQVAATDNVATARQRLLELQRENAPIRQQTRAQLELVDAERQQAQSIQNLGRQNRLVINTQRELLSGARARVSAAKEQIDVLREEHQARIRATMRDGTSRKEAIQMIKESDYAGIELERRKFAQAEEDLATAKREVAQASAMQAAASVPVERSFKNLAPLTMQTQRGLEQLAQTAGGAAVKKIGSFVNPQDVARVTELSNKLTKLGRGGQVKNIAVKSQGADEATAKLQRLQKQSARVDGKVTRLNVKTDDRGAQQKLTGLARLSQRVTGAKNTIRILANSSNAEQAITRLRSHLQAVAQKKYQARIEAIDQTTAPGSKARANLTSIAQKKYQARLDAIDNATAPAKKAGAAADAVGRKNPKVNITANAAQAMGTISSVQSALASLHDKSVTITTTYRQVGSPGGRAEGGPSVYMPRVNEDKMQRAADRAVYEPGGRPRKITRPTMLTGEEAPTHPEYVIASNPAYRADNERYLEDAAGEFGYSLVPAYKKGKGVKKTSTKSSISSKPSTAEILAKRPKNQKSGAGKKSRAPVIPGEGKLYNESPINASQAGIERIEENYERSLDHQEREIRAGRQEEWNWGVLRGFQIAERDERNNLRNKLVPTALRQVKKKEDVAVDYLTKGPGKSSNVKRIRQELSKAESVYDRIEKGDNEDSSHYNKRKRAQKREVERIKKRLEEIETEVKRAKDLIKAAKEARSNLTGTASSQENPIKEAEDDAQYITDVEQGIVEKPYENAAEKKLAKEEEEKTSAGADKPTIGEQTATLSEARQDLYNQFGSNITGTTPVPKTAGVMAASVGSGPMAAAAGARAVGATSTAADAYGPAAMLKKTVAGAFGGTAESSGSGIVNNVTNNFAAPPPDPHTWSKQTEFELGALS